MSPKAIEKTLLEQNKRCDPPLPESEVRNIARSVGRYDPHEDSKPELTTITLSPGESPRAVDEAEKALLDHGENLRIFQRSGEVVRVATLEEMKQGNGLSRKAGTVQLAPVGTVALTETFDRLIQWQRSHTTKEGIKTVRVDCPGKIAAAYLSRVGSWALPPLTGVISAPIMRSDGSILSRSGYDDATGLYLTEDWGELDGNPNRSDALAALQTLKEPFQQFPFVASEDLSVLIAAILTALERRLLESAPLFASSAPTQRTGKTLTMESVAIIATGRAAPAMAVSGDREEMRKAVAAALREGHSIVNLDNIEHPLSSPDLSRAITQPEYRDRLLGETRILRLPTNVVWTATGNNLAFRGDLAVRALVCRLDARVERPEERQFTIRNLKGYILEHRRELVTAALTILRAYVVAGRPEQSLKPWSGFDEWSRTIRAPLAWLEMADPCAGRQHVIEDDPDREQASALLSAWRSVVGNDAVQLANVIRCADENVSLKNALLGVATDKSDGSKVDPRHLAWWCRTWRDRVVAGLCIAKGSDYGKSARWSVEDRSVSGVSGISGVKSPPAEKEKRDQNSLPRSVRYFQQVGNNPNNPTDPKTGAEDREVM